MQWARKGPAIPGPLHGLFLHLEFSFLPSPITFPTFLQNTIRRLFFPFFLGSVLVNLQPVLLSKMAQQMLPDWWRSALPWEKH